MISKLRAKEKRYGVRFGLVARAGFSGGGDVIFPGSGDRKA